MATRDRFKTALAKEMRNVKHHFKKDGWPLDIAVIRDVIITDTLGFSPDSFIWSALQRAGLSVVYSPTDRCILAIKGDVKKELAKRSRAKAKQEQKIKAKLKIMLGE